jgi:hypothetical protein
MGPVGKSVGVMRCIGCGEEMRLLQAVADHTMMVPGYEHHTLECPGCHEVERRLVFARPVEPVPVEPMRLSPDPPASTAPEENERADAPSPDTPSTGAPSTWERALDRLRSQQSFLKERAEGAKTSETKPRIHQTWGFMPPRHAPPPAEPQKPAQEPAQASPTTIASGKDETRHGAAPTGALARVAAKLRSHQATMSARMAEEHSPEGQPFDRVWENTSPSPRRPTPSGKPSAPRPTPLPRSRSLVLITARPAQAPSTQAPSTQAPSTWARALAMLQARQGSAR